MKKLKVLCPQEYAGIEMRVTTCDRCSTGWDEKSGMCKVPTGAEHLPDVPPEQVPTCPMAARCRHQIQVEPAPCTIRSKGLICESALKWAGDPCPEENPLGFSASCVISPEELEMYGT